MGQAGQRRRRRQYFTSRRCPDAREECWYVSYGEHRQDAERFLIDLKERSAKFALSLHPQKTRLLEFGRYAAERRAERGQGKPETFDFLGLTLRVGTIAIRTGKPATRR